MAYAKVSKPLGPDYDFLGNNPWFRITPPYSKMIKKYGDELGNKYMIAIFLMCDPDEELNTFFRMDEDYRKEVISREYVEVDWDDKLISDCLDSYPFDCMDSVERSFKEEKEVIKERAKFMKSKQYTLDIPEDSEEAFDKDIFNAQLKVIDLLEKMAKNTDSIYKQYQKIEEQFIQGKSTGHKKGGMRLTKAEKREV